MLIKQTDIYSYNLGKSGFLSALPYLLMSILIQFSGQWADWFLVKKHLTTTQVRKVFNCTGFLSQTVFMLIAAFWSHPIGSIFCLTMAVGLGAMAWPGFRYFSLQETTIEHLLLFYSVNHLDLAPQHASILMGISNTFATLPGIISPTITGYIVKSPPVSFFDWKNASCIQFVVCADSRGVADCILYCCCDLPVWSHFLWSFCFWRPTALGSGRRRARH